MELTSEKLETIVRGAIRKEIQRTSSDPLLTREEAASFLRVQPCTLAAWSTKGSGPKVTRLGTRVLYRKSSLEEFAEAHTRT